MPSLQFLLRVGPATLFLILCLQLGINKAQEDTPTRKPLIFDVEMPPKAQANQEVTLKFTLGTEMRECMVVKTYLLSNIQISGSFNYVYTRCLCDDHPITFYWDFETNRTATIAIIVDIVREIGICPNDFAVVPIIGNRYRAFKTLRIE